MMDGGGGFSGMPPGLSQAIQSAITNAMSQQLGSTSNERSENGTGTSSVAMSFRVGPDGQLIPSNPAAMQANANSASNGGGTNSAATSSPANSNATNNNSNNRNDNTGAQSQTAGNSQTPPAVDHPPPRMMAEVMTEYRRTQQRLDAHWDRLNTMLQNDPTFDTENDTSLHQSLFRQVTEVMHFLSHAQHALSDAMLNLSTPPPRQLRARPFIIQSMVQSAVVQNVPIAIQVPVGGDRSSNRATPVAGNSTSATPTTEAATANAGGGEPMETESSAASSDGENVSSAVTRGRAEQGALNQLNAALASAARVLGEPPSRNSRETNAPNAAANQGSRNDESEAGEGSGTAESTADIEVSMEPIVVGIEMGPDITIDSEGRMASSSTGSNGTSRNGSPANASFHIGTASGPGQNPSAGMIQNMIQAALSNMGAVANVSVQEITPTTGVRSGGPSPSTTGSSSTNSPSNAQQPGQDSRARGNTQTQPTTSTRTRSSTQIINMTAGPMGPPMGFMPGPGGPNSFPAAPNNNFDILLPCNSHHIPQNANRQRRHRQQQASQQQQRPRSASVPPRGPVGGNLRRTQAGAPTTGSGTTGGKIQY